MNNNEEGGNTQCSVEATETTPSKERKFYVALSKTKPEVGIASCTDGYKSVIKEFYREYAGHEIRYVDDEEFCRLMKAPLNAA